MGFQLFHLKNFNILRPKGLGSRWQNLCYPSRSHLTGVQVAPGTPKPPRPTSMCRGKSWSSWVLWARPGVFYIYIYYIYIDIHILGLYIYIEIYSILPCSSLEGESVFNHFMVSLFGIEPKQPSKTVLLWQTVLVITGVKGIQKMPILSISECDWGDGARFSAHLSKHLEWTESFHKSSLNDRGLHYE